jgi:LmbE family N-acetylglucosaminyl deacetylase
MKSRTILTPSPASQERVLVVAAHPDDEALGCGGTIANHVNRGDIVQVLFLADGEAARKGTARPKSRIVSRMQSAIRASLDLGANRPIFLGLPDNQLDSIPLLHITRKIETVALKFSPTVVYTHHGGDLNIDHQISHRAAITAFRPMPGQSVKAIYCFEVLSSTAWCSTTSGSPFVPNRFCDISDTLARKISSLQNYKSELRPYPHARSLESVRALASYRGASVGVEMAEAFMVERQLVPPAVPAPSSRQTRPPKKR